MGLIDINPKHKAAFSYKPIAKWIICGNHMPALDDYSDGWWRRLHIIEWNVQVKGKDIIHDLDERIIRDELHIVLDWALAGLSRLVERGNFEIPEAVERSKQTAKADANAVTSWVWTTGAMLDVDARTLKEDLYASYREHCEEKGFPACNDSQFFKRLKGEIPGTVEQRVIVGNGKNRRRARIVNIALGRFEDEPAAPSQPQELEDDPFKM
jgi:putative DNA primase/helicase